VRTTKDYGHSEKPGEDQPLIEVHVSYERGSRPSASRLTRALEVVTKNHIYVLDASLRCVEVRRNSVGETIIPSPYVGARLSGGYFATDNAIEISYPFPRPGSVAVFETMKGRSRVYQRTSTVTRVDLHLSIVTVTTKRGVPSWEDIVRTVSRGEG
jgi:hypothetical protein